MEMTFEKKTSMETSWIKKNWSMIKKIDQLTKNLLTWTFHHIVVFDPENMFCCRKGETSQVVQIVSYLVNLQGHNFEKFNTAVVSFWLALP